jgi:acyl carrier protein
MDETTLHRVRQLVADLFDQPIADISPESSPQSVTGWDSMGHLNLVLAIEQEFGVRFSPGDVEGIRSVETAVALVSARSSNP